MRINPVRLLIGGGMEILAVMLEWAHNPAFSTDTAWMMVVVIGAIGFLVLALSFELESKK